MITTVHLGCGHFMEWNVVHGQALSGDRQSVEIRHCSEDVHVHNCSVCPYMLIPSLLGTLLLERTRSHGCNLSTIFLSI